MKEAATMKGNQNQATNKLDTIGKRVKYLRKQNELTQEKLAEYLNVEKTKVSKMENGKICIPCSDLPRLCELFHTTADFIALGKTNDTATSLDLSGFSPEKVELIRELSKRLKSC